MYHTHSATGGALHAPVPKKLVEKGEVMVDSKKPGENPVAAEPKERPQTSSTSSTNKAAKARAFVKAQKEDQKKSDKTDYSDKKTEETEETQKKPRTGLLWFFLLCALGLSAVTGYGFYYLWQQSQEQQSSALSRLGELKQTQTAIIDVRDDFKVLQNDLGEESANRAAALGATQGTIDLLEKTIGKQSRQMQALTQTNRDEWLLAETEYLLRLANQRILMSKESSGAMAMLQSADKILHEIDDVSLHPVRRAIANDVTALRRTKAVDVDGEYLKLAALGENLDELVLYDIPEFRNDEQEDQVEVTMPAQPTWQESLSQVGGSIKSTLSRVFVVRQQDRPIEAMLPPQQELYLRQNLRLMLEQAQLALLARKPATYQQSLDKAQQWIARYFIGEDAATQGALRTLAEARTIDIDPPLPDISGSYHALKEYTDSAHSRKLKASAAKQTQPSEEEPRAEVEEASSAKVKKEPAQASKTDAESGQKTIPEKQPEVESELAKEKEKEQDAKSEQGSEQESKPKVELKQELKQEPNKEFDGESASEPEGASKPHEEVMAAVMDI